MSVTADLEDRLVSFRRDLHRRPEPAWREFYTTARIVEELRDVGVDDLYVGEEVYAGFAGEREALPDAAELAVWRDRAIAAGADPDLVERMGEGYTGAVAVLRMGEGPTVGLRVDIDGLRREESEDPDHVPATEGFRSENEGMMHACGHDAHATFGVGALAAIKESSFSGTLKLFFQPGEEHGAGGRPMAESDHIADVDYFYAVHVGMDRPTGVIIPGISEWLAVSNADVSFHGRPAHAGGKPHEGRNALLAMATAIQNLYAIPRHGEGATRIGVGPAEGGTASNVVAEEATLSVGVRGETNEIHEHVREWADRVFEGAATMHGCEVETDWSSGLPTAPSDAELTAIVESVAEGTASVTGTDYMENAGGSEDATVLMKAVQDRGGKACYLGVGTDHPDGHHTARFDVDEESLAIGVEVLAGTVVETAERRP